MGSLFLLSSRHTLMLVKAACLALILFIIFYVSYTYRGRTGEKRESEKLLGQEAPKPSFSMKDFHLEDFDGRRKAFSIRGHSLVIENKKVGFLRFGLLDVARVENAEIDIYLPPGQSETLPATRHAPQGPTGDHRQADVKPLDFNGQLGIFADKRIAEFELCPVRMRIHDEKGLRSMVESRYATLDLKKRSLAFSGAVRVSSGKSRLATERLYFFSGDLRFQADGSFVLQTPDTTMRGKKLETDLFLEPAAKPAVGGGQDGQFVSKKGQE